MFQLLFWLFFGALIWIVWRKSQRLPIIPGQKEKDVPKKTTDKIKVKKNKRGEKLADPDQVDFFKDLFADIKEIDNHMIRHQDETFVLLAEATPVNYFLLSSDEQESIDVIFENWLASINYNVKIYLQNRYIDLSEPIEQMRDYMIKQDDLSVNSREYGRSLIDDLTRWQYSLPRYETKRYLAFSIKINPRTLTVDDETELEERIIDKAFQELYRRFFSAKNSLRRANVELDMLSNEGIYEVFYYAFNRRKALKNKFKHFREHEIDSIYVTADQDDTRIQMVKEGIENEMAEQKKERNSVRVS